MITNDTYDYGEGMYTEGFGANLDKTVTHKRSLKFVKDGGYWILTDTFIPSDTLSHTYDTWFHFNTPLYGIDKRNHVVYSKANDKANIAIVHFGSKTNIEVVVGQTSPEIQGWLSVKGGENGFHCVPTSTPVFHLTGKGICKEIYVFLPFRASEDMPIVDVRKNTIFLKNGEKIDIAL